MAEDKKPDIQADWDNLPLDPDAADDWDDIPPPAAEKALVAATSTALEKVSPAEDYYEAQSDRHKNDGDSADDTPYAPPPDTPDSEAPADSAAVPEPEDDFDVPDEAPPEPTDSDTPGETLDEAVSEAPAEAPDDDDDAPEPPDDDDFDAPDFIAPPAPSESDPPEAAEDETIPMPNISEPKPPTKKVELDIEGMQFKEDAPPPEPPAAPAAPEEKAPPKAAAPPPKEAEPAAEPKIRRKIPRLKLLLIAVPALLILVGLFFGLSALFSDPDPSELPPPPPVFSPDLPPREAVLGEMRLESFYISFPGRSNDTIIELSLVLHYNDSPDAILIRGKMTDLRDIIYRVTQGKGSLIITDSELQRGLREELRERANTLLGGDYISYVQIDQIRILQ